MAVKINGRKNTLNWLNSACVPLVSGQQVNYNTYIVGSASCLLCVLHIIYKHTGIIHVMFMHCGGSVHFFHLILLLVAFDNTTLPYIH